MFLFTTLLITLLTISGIILVTGIVGGTTLLLVFGDLIVFGLFVAFIVKRLANR